MAADQTTSSANVTEKGGSPILVKLNNLFDFLVERMLIQALDTESLRGGVTVAWC